MTIKGIVVPCDLEKPMVEVQGDSYLELCRTHTNIQWPERVNTMMMHTHNLVMAVDGDGHDRRLPLNLRALIISQYGREYALVGDAILFSEAMANDGMTFVSVGPSAMDLLKRWEVEERARVVHRKMAARMN